MHGNFLNLNHHNDLALYDRIYVGMGVSDEHENFLKNLIKVNGILIMPLNDSVSLKKELFRVFNLRLMILILKSSPKSASNHIVVR